MYICLHIYKDKYIYIFIFPCFSPIDGWWSGLQGTLHRTSLEPQPDAAVKRGEHRKAPLQRFAAATPETPATDALETPAAAEDLSH